ncbi:MAG: hypothetical protein IKJ13_04235 [Clostridia bacterium]|nr:hypothetical protein [Clostridia bacterium]
MNKLLESLKARILYPLIPAPIEKNADYVKRIVFLIFAAICFVGGLILGIIVPKEHIIQIYVYLGAACSIPFMPKIFKTSFRAGKTSYKVGKIATEREYIEVNHVGGGQYRARRKKENDGDIFAIFGGTFVFLCLFIFYSLTGPFLLGYKSYKTFDLIKEYKSASVEITDESIEK